MSQRTGLARDLAKRFRRIRHRGVFAQSSLSHWKRLLREWCVIHEQYCKLVHDDAIYWSIERSNLAALAGAAWRLGWAALEEFPQTKTSRRARFAGRTDLYLKSRGRDEYIESKMVWLTLRGGADASANIVMQGLESACDDASAVHVTERTERRIGIVFAVPYYPKGRVESLSAFDAVFESLSRQPIDAAAWCFPSCARELAWGEPKVNVYPGVILAARRV